MCPMDTRLTLHSFSNHHLAPDIYQPYGQSGPEKLLPLSL